MKIGFLVECRVILQPDIAVSLEDFKMMHCTMHDIIKYEKFVVLCYVDTIGGKIHMQHVIDALVQEIVKSLEKYNSNNHVFTQHFYGGLVDFTLLAVETKTPGK